MVVVDLLLIRACEVLDGRGYFPGHVYKASEFFFIFP